MAYQSILARLGVVMTVNSAEFKKGIDDATKETRAFQAELKRQNNESKKFAGEVGAAFTKIATVVAVAGAAIYKAFSYADQIKDTADALDVTVASLMRMRTAFQNAGGEADNLGNLMNKLVINQDKAREGADNVRDAFTRLGISGKEVESLGTDELFSRVARALGEIEDPAKRNALAFEILGKAAKGVNWRDYWEDYASGKNATENVSQAIEASAKAWDNLKQAGTSALNAILVLAKPLADLINRFADAIKDAEKSGRTDKYSDAFNQAKKELENDPNYLQAGLKVRRQMIDARAQELMLAQKTAAVDSGKTDGGGAKGGYSKASTKDISAQREMTALKEAFRIRVEGLSKVSEQVARERELIGLTETEAEIKKANWALEDEALKMQLELQKQIELEKAKGQEADKQKIELLKEQMSVYGVLIDMTKRVTEEEIRSKEARIRQQQILTNTERQGLDQMVNNFQVLGQQSKKAFDAWKAFSIVQTIIDTYSGAQKAFTSMAGIPFIGPALGFAAAATAVAAGMARVQMIRSMQYQGRQRGGSIVANTPYMVGEAGPELVIPHKGGTVIPNNQLSSVMGQGGGVSYNGPYIANLQAIDTQSAMDFIAKNKQAIWSANLAAQRSVPSLR